MEPGTFQEINSLASPPNGESIDPDVRAAAVRVVGVASLADPSSPTAEQLQALNEATDNLYAACDAAAG
jgi:hypothetical protein